jgi:hypothetical protein
VPIAAPEPDVLGMIRELDRDPERLARARAASVTTFLRRHDWAHRWREVLRLVGMDERPALAARLAGLEARYPLLGSIVLPRGAAPGGQRVWTRRHDGRGASSGGDDEPGRDTWGNK